MARLTELRLSGGPLVGKVPTATGRRHHLSGRPSNNRHTPENFADRFWRKVRRDGPGGCWQWVGSRLPNGRGQVHLRWDGPTNVRKYAYVVAWELTHGPVPDGVHVCHNCPAGDSPNCVNPSHLFLGTQADNVHDSIHKSRRNAFGIQKLHPPQVREIRALAARGGLTHREIAQRFGVARNTVRHIVARRSWGHLTDTDVIAPVFERVPHVHLPIRGDLHLAQQAANPIAVHLDESAPAPAGSSMQMARMAFREDFA